MKVIYVAGAYRADTPEATARNIRRAEAVARQLWRMGAAVICPHLNSFFFDGLVPDEWFLNGYLEMVRRSDMVVTVPNWVRSQGAKAEVWEAQKRRIPVLHWPWDRKTIKEWVQGDD